MNFVIKDKNRIEYQTRHGLCKGTYVIKNIKIIFKNLIIKDEQVCIYVNNQFNLNKIVADYMTLKELLDNYIIIGKIKRHIHDFKD